MANPADTTDPQDRISALESRVGALEDRLASSTITPDDLRSYHKVAAHLQSLAANPPVWSCTNAVAAGGPVWSCTHPAMVWSCAQAAAAPTWSCGGPGGGTWACFATPSASGPVWSCSGPKPQGLADVSSDTPPAGSASFGSFGK